MVFKITHTLHHLHNRIDHFISFQHKTDALLNLTVIVRKNCFDCVCVWIRVLLLPFLVVRETEFVVRHGAVSVEKLIVKGITMPLTTNIRSYTLYLVMHLYIAPSSYFQHRSISVRCNGRCSPRVQNID